MTTDKHPLLVTSVSQAPLLVSWQRRLLGRFHVTGVFWYRLHFWAMRHLPRPLLPITLLAFASFFTIVLVGMRRAIANNLEWVHGSRVGWLTRQRWAFRTIFNHAWCMTETYEGHADHSRELDIEVEGEEHWRDLMGRTPGFVLVTAHVGHWEVGSRVRSPHKTRRIHVVRAPEIDPEAQEFLANLLRQSCGEHLEMHFTRPDDPSLGARLLLALRAGEIVAVQGDRPRDAQRTITATLFGRSLELPLGAAAMGRAADTALLPIFVFRRGRSKSTLVFRPPIAVPHTKNREQDWQVAVDAIAREVEWAIRREPHQWFCFRDLWGRIEAR
jgi:lauroyl/myristoyl acyltransferase